MNSFYDFASTYLRWLPALMIMVIIFMVSSTPSSQLPNFGSMATLVEIGGHLLGYALLAQSLLLGIGNRDPKSYVKAGIVAILYGVGDEFHQSFVPGRNASFFDLCVDSLGTLASLSTTVIYERIITGYHSPNSRSNS